MENKTEYDEYTDFFRYTRLGLINYRQNEELLNTVPHRKFLDLAIVMLRADRRECSPSDCEYVTFDDLHSLGLSEAKAFMKAKLSGQDLGGIYFAPISETLEFLSGREAPFWVPGMYILSNLQFCYGAAIMTYGGLLSAIYDSIGSNFYVIPSSVNELIIMEDCGGEGYGDYLEEILRIVNRMDCTDQVFLSDNVYYYDHKTDELTLHIGESVN